MKKKAAVKAQPEKPPKGHGKPDGEEQPGTGEPEPGEPDVVEPPPIIPPPVTDLPTSYFLDTPPVGQQGNEGACVPFAVACARSIEEYYRTKSTSYNGSTNVYSPEYLYSQTKVGDCGSGTSITACLDYMYAMGIIHWDAMPFVDTDGCSHTPTPEELEAAAKHKIPTYTKLLSTDYDLIKTALANNHPIVINLNIDNNFTNAGPGYIWDSIAAGNAPHGVVIVGYDDDMGAFKIQNSFGTGWGDAGFLWVTYPVYQERCGYNVWVLDY